MFDKRLYFALLTTACLVSLGASANELAPEPQQVPSTEEQQASVETQTPYSDLNGYSQEGDPQEGYVQKAQPAPQVAADFMAIEFDPSRKPKHKLREVSVRLDNKQAKHLEVLQVEVLNGLNEQTYYQIQQQKSQAKRKAAGGLLRGVTGVATNFIPYAGIGSVVAYQAVSAGTNAAYTAANVLENSGGSVDYANRVIQRANNIVLSPNQPLQFLAVVPEKEQPVVRVVFKDLQTNQIYELQK